MKKGQAFDGPIIYFFIAIVLFVAVYFGVKYISNSVDYSEDVMIQEFVTSFNVKIQKAYYSNPDLKISLESVSVPVQIKEICFVDFTKEINLDNVQNEEFKKFLEAVDVNSENNLFIYGDFRDSKFSYFELENVIAKENLNPVCDINHEGKVNFKAVSTNKKVELIVE